MRRLLLLAPPVALLAACNSAHGPAPGGAFDPSEAAFIKKAGKATIGGRAFLRDKTGQTNVRYAAGETVRLIPASSYARARIAHFYGGGKFAPAAAIPKIEPDPQYVDYTRTTKADASGRFTFDHVAPGRYFLTTQLIWKPKESLLAEGGAMYEEVIVTGGERAPIDVIVSGN